MLLTTLTTWGIIGSYVRILEGTTVLNTELYSMNSILMLVFLLSRWEIAV